MDYESEHDEHEGNTLGGFLVGILVGGLVGAGAMLLLAPQSGQQTRAKIRQKGEALRTQAVDSMDEVMDQARTAGRTITDGVQQQADKIQQTAEKIQQRGQDLLDEQKERWSPVVAAGKKAAKSS